MSRHGCRQIVSVVRFGAMLSKTTLLPVSTPLLSIHAATVVKGNTTLLDDLNLEIARSEHTAILGPNGSGKSSLIRLLTREYYPLARSRSGEQSSVRILGQERWNVVSLRTLLGIVSSELHQTFTRSSEGITGKEAVLSGLFGSIGLAANHVVTEAMHAQADAALRGMEAMHLRDQPMETMSTGEARRIVIARALVSDPQALLLDEPTTGLDLVATRRFMETVRTIAQRGKTILLVTHHIQEILPEVERVILLRNGRVFHDGRKEEVLSKDTLSELYRSSITVTRSPTGFYTADAS